MKQIYVRELMPDSHVRSTFLVKLKERKIASTGAAYLDLTLQDTTGTIPAKLWDYSERNTPSFEIDDVVAVEANVESFRGVAQLRIRKILLCPPRNLTFSITCPAPNVTPR